MFIRVLVLSALAGMSVSGCQPAGKDAGNDTTGSLINAPADTSVTVEPIAEPAIAVQPKVTPGPQGLVKEAGPSKNELLRLDQAKKAAEAARADSIKQAQGRAEAIRIARLDSVKRAEAARAVARTEPIVPAGAGQVAQGKTPYEENCRKCHGVLGVPPKAMKAKFPKIMAFDAAFFAKRSSDSVVTVLTKGVDENMKSFRDKLSHSQMVAVAAYIRSFGQR
jgi:Cytochrome c.